MDGEMRIDYEIVFDEPWRVASGEGAGRHLDSRVRKDPRGVPFVPGTTLRGLVREAVETLARELGRELCSGTLERRGGELGSLCGTNREGCCARCRLLGSPRRPGSVRWGAARLATPPGTAGRRLAEEAAKAPGYLSRVHPRTAVDPASGRAEDERLFTREEASPRLVLRGRLELDGGLGRDDVALLVGALRFVRELGGGRRRGLGACRVRVTEARLEPLFDGWRQAVRHLGEAPGGADAAAAAPSVPGAQPSRPASPRPAARVGKGLRDLVIDARVEGEVVLGARPESGNLVRGLAHVPGSTLRGALAARWRRGYETEEFDRLFLSGAVRFGFLYPKAGERLLLPRRASIVTCKLRPGPVGDLGHGVVDLLADPGRDRCPQCGGRLVLWRRDRGGPGLVLSPHNRIDSATQSAGDGALFAYEALPDGTRLGGALAAEDARDLELLAAGLGLSGDPPWRLDLRVGRRKGALGRLACTLRPPELEASGVGLFPEGEPLPAGAPAAVRIDLLTPALLLDEGLRYRGLEPADLGLDRALAAAFERRERIAGWNAAHGLPKADEEAVAAGSTYLLERPAPDELEALRGAARRGVGRRRAEGFGALAFAEVETDEVETDGVETDDERGRGRGRRTGCST